MSGFSRTVIVSGFSRTDQGAGPKGPLQAGPKGPALQGGFEDALAVAKELPRLHSLLVSRHGELVLERYYNGARATRPANIKSASKSLISALVGIAIDRRLISDVDAPIAAYFPELKKDRDPAKQRITIEDLLTMRSGLETTSNRNYGAWVQSRNWVQHALSRPMFSEPGHADGVQHRQHASALGDPHEGDGGEHLAVCQRHDWPPTRLHDRALASGSSGHLLRRQRHAAHAAADARVRSVVSGARTRQRPTGRARVVGSRGHWCRGGVRTGAIRNMGTAGGSASWADIARTMRGASAVSTSSSFRICNWSSSRHPPPRSPRIAAATGGTCSISWST